MERPQQGFGTPYTRTTLKYVPLKEANAAAEIVAAGVQSIYPRRFNGRKESHQKVLYSFGERELGHGESSLEIRRLMALPEYRRHRTRDYAL